MEAKKFFSKVTIAVLSAVVIGSGAAVIPQITNTGIIANAASVNEIEPNNTFATATPVNAGDVVTGALTGSDSDFYAVTLNESGTLNIKFNSNVVEYFDKINLYSSVNNNIRIDYIFSKGSTLSANLNAGKYYVEVVPSQYGSSSSYRGSYQLNFGFESAKETAAIKETLTHNNNSIKNADTISVNKSYNAFIAQTEKEDYYKFTLGGSGKVTLDLTGYMHGTYVVFYNSKGDIITKDWFYYNSKTNRIDAKPSLNLRAGTYYIGFTDSSSGKYSFKLNYASAGESCKETETSNNDTIAKANSISVNKTYKGQIAATETKDFYKFTLKKSGTVKIKFTGYMKEVDKFSIYDTKKQLIDHHWYYYDTKTNRIEETETLYLRAGTYYIGVENSNDSLISYKSGNYNIRVNFTDAKESFPESVSKNDDTFARANKINLNQVYNGQIAYDEGKDFYKFTLSKKSTVKIKLNAQFSDTSYNYFGKAIIYNSSKLQKWTSYSISSYNTHSLSQTLGTESYNKIELPKGTYYLAFEGNKGSPNNYNFKVIVNIPTTKIKLSKSSVTLGKGESLTLKTTFTPSNASNKTITWKTSNSKVATVKNGKITAKKAGTVTITAKTSNGKTATCKVTVKNAPSKVTLSKKTLTLKKGSSATLKVSLPKNTASYKKTFTSSNKNVVTVNSSGKVTAKKAGTAYITVKTFNGKTAKCKVTVKN